MKKLAEKEGTISIKFLLDPGGPIIYQNHQNRFLGTIYKEPGVIYAKEGIRFPSIINHGVCGIWLLHEN